MAHSCCILGVCNPYAALVLCLDVCSPYDILVLCSGSPYDTLVLSALQGL